MVPSLAVVALQLALGLTQTGSAVHLSDVAQLGAVPKQIPGLAERLQFAFGGIANRDVDGDVAKTESKTNVQGHGHACSRGKPDSKVPFMCSAENRAPCKLAHDTVDRGCERNQMECDDSLFSTGFFMPCCEKSNLFNILEFIDGVLCDKVEYGLMSDSLLAALRDGDLLDWHPDVDIVVDIIDQERVTTLLNEAAGNFSVSERSDVDLLHGHDTDALRVSWGGVNKRHANIFWAHHVQNCTKINGEVFPSFWFPRPFRGRCQLQGRTFPCPDHGDKVLDYLFGSQPGMSWRENSGRHGIVASVCRNASQCSVNTHGFSCALPVAMESVDLDPSLLRGVTPLHQVSEMFGPLKCLILFMSIISLGVTGCFFRICATGKQRGEARSGAEDTDA